MKADQANSAAPRRPPRAPDPLKAHGALVLLAVSIVAGTLTAVRDGPVQALAAGLGFGGVFLCASALATRSSRKRIARLLWGGTLASAAPLLALMMGANPIFLLYGLVAVFPAALSGLLGARYGFRSPGALAFGIAALVVAAPSSACAGGATPLRSWLLLALLAPFFAWRAGRVARLIGAGGAVTRDVLRRQGWREALYAVTWTFISVAVIHLVE